VESEIELGERIVRWREHKGFTQASLAAAIEKAAREDGEKAHCSPSAVAQWELSQTTPTQTNLGFLAKALEISLAQFWGRVPVRKKRAS
jgi:transcriptional regulator with XRE-family HTH domain